MALVALLVAASAMAAGHCLPHERTVFNCRLQSGKVVSVCGSADLTRTSGYLQYRSGRLGKPELVFPPHASTGTQGKFEFESHRPYLGESESLSFANGTYKYTVYRVVTTDPESRNGAGVFVAEVKGSDEVNRGDLKCTPALVATPMGLEDVVPEAK